MLIHADNYCLCDFKAFLQAHEQRDAKCLMTLMSFSTNTPESCGIIEVDENNIVTGFYEKVARPPGNLANGAVYIISNKVIELMTEKKYDDFSIQVIPNLLGKILNYENRDIHIDIGTPATYNQAQNIKTHL